MFVISMVGMIVLVLVGIVLLCFGAVWMEKRYPVEDYDERQKAARGRGYRLSFWTGIVYYFIVAMVLIQQVDGEKTVEPWLLVAIGILLQAAVQHTYALLSHAALPLSGKPLVMVFSHLFCGALQFINFSMHWEQYSMNLVGYGTSAWIFLIAGTDFFYLAALYFVQFLRDRKE